jgi:hypothetical protein
MTATLVLVFLLLAAVFWVLTGVQENDDKVKIIWGESQSEDGENAVLGIKFSHINSHILEDVNHSKDVIF